VCRGRLATTKSCTRAARAHSRTSVVVSGSAGMPDSRSPASVVFPCREISTLGDPLADLAYALNPWPDPSDEEPPSAESATSVPGFPSRNELAQRYADRTGRNLDKLDYYIGFNRWKTAAILHGVYARYKEGKKSTDGIDLVEMKKRILDSLTLAQEAVDRLQ